jgi:hypothetical protein
MSYQLYLNERSKYSQLKKQFLELFQAKKELEELLKKQKLDNNSTIIALKQVMLA